MIDIVNLKRRINTQNMDAKCSAQ